VHIYAVDIVAAFMFVLASTMRVAQARRLSIGGWLVRRQVGASRPPDPQEDGRSP
jgi:hypothetical protein